MQKQTGYKLLSGNLQEILDSATNAAELGTSSFYTPPGHAEMFTIPLAKFHGACLDFEMGAGNLLRPLTGQLKLGVDLDERTRKPNGAEGVWQTACADVTKLYPLWRDVDFAADTITINPPFSLRWHSERLRGLCESHVEAVAAVAKEVLRKPTVDSTLASLLIALDRCTSKGEGYMVCNAGTARKFLGDPDADNTAAEAPAAALREHIWLWLTVPGGFFENVLTDMEVAVIYFSPAHYGDKPLHLIAPDNSPATLRNLLSTAAAMRYSLRRGASLTYQGDSCERTAGKQFDAAKSEYGILWQGKEHPFNIWLGIDGTIQRHLTPFQAASRKVDRNQVNKLNAIQGQRPMALVVQRATRAALLSVIRSEIWKVDPALLEQVEKAVGEYNAVRAPFYPLNDVQRLGYLDEEDAIACRDGMQGDFTAGKSYQLATSTRKVTRKGSKLSPVTGNKQELELTGVELFITITDNGGNIHEFTHRKPGDDGDGSAFHHDLETLVRHFTIPDVPDVARLRPQEYERALTELGELEELINQNRRQSEPRGASAARALAGAIHAELPRALQRFAFRQYQRDDLARSVLHDGCVFAWDTGLGKTAAIFGWSHLLRPKGCRAVLIVAPGGLHEQIIDDARDLFGVTVKRLYSQYDFHRDPLLQEIHRARLNGQPHPLEKTDRPVYWITSYIDLGFSGADEWTPKEDEAGELIVGHRLERERNQIADWLPEYNEGIGEEVTYANGHTVRCVHKPSLATLTQDIFDAVCCDEAVAIKSTGSYRSLGVRRMNPQFRLILTATPVKNHLDDIFWLVQWACGGHAEPTARWPYENTSLR